MLGLQTIHKEETRSTMEMDYSQYLLSASPPSSSFDLLSFSSSQAFNQFRNPVPFDYPTCSGPTGPAATFTPPASFQCMQSQMAQPGPKNMPKNLSPLKSSLKDAGYNSSGSTGYSSESDADSGSESAYCVTPRRRRKKVHFADNSGLALAQVRLVKESPDEPPNLDLSLISSLTLGSSADVESAPPIKVCFSQPASDYLAFRDKINANKVCLENVIVRDYSVEGTIKVKNISFEKKVFVRLTLDDWISFSDTEATYVPGPGSRCNFPDPYDTFSFKLEISPSFDVTKELQFAVCFESNGKQHWDNKGGCNYVLVSADYDKSKDSPKFYEKYLPTKRKEETWSEFSIWRSNSDTPYY